jgi:hypothetical protein
MPKRHTNAVFLGDLRGRTAGKLIRLERIAIDVDVSASITSVRRDLEAIDRVIGLFDPRIDPSTLPVIHSNKKFRRGPKGGLTLVLKEILAKAGTAGLLTREIGRALQVQHSAVFESEQEFSRFLRNTLKCRLRNLVKMGVVESDDDEIDVGNGLGVRATKRWRLKGGGTSIESLVADAKARGAEVIVVDAQCQLPAGNDPPA